MNKKHYEMHEEAIKDIIDCLENGYSGYYCDLHNKVFNTEYYADGYNDAEHQLKEYGVFDAIRCVMRYEQNEFGEIYTKLYEPEEIINMLYYIIGDEIIGDMCMRIPEFNDNWNERAVPETNDVIIETLKGWL